MMMLVTGINNSDKEMFYNIDNGCKDSKTKNIKYILNICLRT